jgi:myo-inositol-1(or 4)-monophosphatase
VLLDIATEAARAAAASIRSRASEATRLVWTVKRPADFVTEVDTESEQLIRDIIARHLPDATVVGEELSPDALVHAGTVFVVDPLDGTTNFLHGFPWYAVSIGVLVDGTLEAGIVLNVPTGDEHTARRGHGAHRNGERARVSEIVDPAYALIGTGFPFKHLQSLDVYQRQFEAVTRATSGIRRPGSAALDLAAVACGQYDAFWELSLAPWDIAAGALLVQEAGGIITNLDGEPFRVSHTPLIAGNPVMHARLLEILRATG